MRSGAIVREPRWYPQENKKAGSGYAEFIVKSALSRRRNPAPAGSELCFLSCCTWYLVPLLVCLFFVSPPRRGLGLSGQTCTTAATAAAAAAVQPLQAIELLVLSPHGLLYAYPMY